MVLGKNNGGDLGPVNQFSNLIKIKMVFPQPGGISQRGGGGEGDRVLRGGEG